MTRKIISAYETIMDYCAHYQYSFSEDTVKNTSRLKNGGSSALATIPYGETAGVRSDVWLIKP
jgi:hypothetical protein